MHSAIVLHLSEEFSVVSLKDTSTLVAVPLKRHLNDTYWFDSERLSLGQEISVKLLSLDADENGLLLGMQNVSTEREKGKVPLNFGKRGPVIGEMITGTVKSVKPTSVLVSITDKLTGTIHASQIMETVPLGSLPTSKLRPKQSVTCRVIGGRDVKTHKYAVLRLLRIYEPITSYVPFIHVFVSF